VCPLNPADYALISFNYDNVTDDFSLEHFDHNGAGSGGGGGAASVCTSRGCRR